jgi:hypothetical protein
VAYYKFFSSYGLVVLHYCLLLRILKCRQVVPELYFPSSPLGVVGSAARLRSVQGVQGL